MSVLRVLICYLVILAIFGCGGHRPVRQRVLLPPTLNLVPHHNIGLFEFSVENGKGNLQQFATQRFEEYVLAAQSGIEMREFTSADSARVFSSSADSNTTPVAFFGHLKISNVKPHGGLTAGLSPVMRATVTVELSVWLVHSRTGGVLWRRRSPPTHEGGGPPLNRGPPSPAGLPSCARRSLSSCRCGSATPEPVVCCGAAAPRRRKKWAASRLPAACRPSRRATRTTRTGSSSIGWYTM